MQFVQGAKVLVHDTTYTTEEYDFHRGWGHSTFRETTELALNAGVETLVLFHHEPRRTDEELDQRVAECRALVAKAHWSIDKATHESNLIRLKDAAALAELSGADDQVGSLPGVAGGAAPIAPRG